MWQQQMQQRRLSDAGLVSKQGKATNIKQRCMKHDNKRCRTNYCHKNRGEIWRRLGQIGHLAFGHAVIHQLAHQQGLEFENVLPGMSSTSISAHLWRKPKQLCVLCAVRWLSREGGYLGWGSSYAWSSKLVDGSSFLDIKKGMDMKLQQQEVASSSPHVLKTSNIEVLPVPGKM